MNIRELAKQIILSSFNERESFFDHTWEFIDSHFEKIGNLVASGFKERNITVPLGISSAEKRPSVMAVLLFVDASKEVVVDPTPDKLIAAVKEAGKKYQAQEQLMQKMVSSLQDLMAQPAFLKFKSEAKEPAAFYARMWTKDGHIEGNLIKKEEFEERVREKRKYKVFIIDAGEFRQGFVGEVYLDGKLWSKIEDEAEGKAEKGYLTPLFYRILLHTLKHECRAGDIPTLIEACWKNAEAAKNLKRLNPYERNEQTRTHRKTMSLLNKLLKQKVGAIIKAQDDGIYHMTRRIVYCILEIL